MSGVSNPNSSLTNVDLPDPFSPNIAIFSPRPIEKDKFSITYLVYRAMGLSALGFIDVVALQSVISISVDMLPLPGGMGISEGLFLNIFFSILVNRSDTVSYIS